MSPEQKFEYVGFRIPATHRQELEDLAKKKDLTLTQVFRQAVREYLASQKAA